MSLIVSSEVIVKETRWQMITSLKNGLLRDVHLKVSLIPTAKPAKDSLDGFLALSLPLIRTNLPQLVL